MEELVVLSIEQALHLQKDLGLDMSDAKFCWFKYKLPSFIKEDEKWTLALDYSNNKKIETIETIPTYTLQEILKKIPLYGSEGEFIIFPADNEMGYGIFNYGEFEGFEDGKNGKEETFEFTISGAYEMLCCVLKEGKDVGSSR